LPLVFWFDGVDPSEYTDVLLKRDRKRKLDVSITGYSG
jgi:hypothetical protein